MEAFIYVLWALSLILHIALNLIVRHIVCREEFAEAKIMPRFHFIPTFLALITLWWRPSGHPAENKKTLRLMKAANYVSIAFIICSILALVL